MSEISFKCPNCSQSLTAPSSAHGRKMTCPACRASIALHEDSDVNGASNSKSTPDRPMKQCPFCGEDILAVAIKCKHCGEFFEAQQAPASPPPASVATSGKSSDEEIVWSGNPSHIRYLGTYILGGILSFIIIGLIIIAWALLERANTVFTVTNRRVTAKRGILSRSTQEVLISDIRTINTTQTFTERLFGIGTVHVGSAGTGGLEVIFDGIPRADAVKDMISRQR